MIDAIATWAIKVFAVIAMGVIAYIYLKNALNTKPKRPTNYVIEHEPTK